MDKSDGYTGRLIYLAFLPALVTPGLELALNRSSYQTDPVALLAGLFVLTLFRAGCLDSLPTNASSDRREVWNGPALQSVHLVCLIGNGTVGGSGDLVWTGWRGVDRSISVVVQVIHDFYFHVDRGSFDRRGFLSRGFVGSL